MSKINFTAQNVKTLEPGVWWDTSGKSPRGFLVHVTPNKARAYRLNYRNANGVERRLTIGDVGTWKLSEARAEAARLRVEIDKGADPLGEARQRRGAPTVRQLVERYMAEVMPQRAPRTQSDYRDLINRFILPALADKKVDAVTRDEIEQLHRSMTAKVRANRTLSVIKLIFEHAIRWGWRSEDSNPARRIAPNPEAPCERYLTEEELERLLTALDHYRAKPEPHWSNSADMITLLLLTGARRGEVVGARWGQFDLEAGTWTKPRVMTKQCKLHRAPLSAEALALMRRRHDADHQPSPVVPLRRDDRIFGNDTVVQQLENDWRVIRGRAQLDDVRLHDLRHSYASFLASSGLSLPIIGALLGHSRAETTQRYAHLCDAPLRAATGLVGEKIAGKAETSGQQG